MAETLRSLNDMSDIPAPLADSVLVLIDCQNTYTDGVMALDGVEAALDEAAVLLDRARSAGIPVIHIQHDDGAGSAYDVGGWSGAIVDRVAPRDGEQVVVKELPNAFAGTGLADLLQGGARKDLLLAGFMTHMCVSSTARAAFSLGYRPSVVGGATATRALPGPDGTTVEAAVLQAASLASIADLFGPVVSTTADVPA